MADAANVVVPIKDGEPPLGSFANPFLRDDSETLDIALRTMGYDFRWNARAKRIEYREAVVSPDPTPWETATDRVTGNIRDKIERQYWVARKTVEASPLKYGRDRWQDCLNALLYFREVDPFKQYLESLPAWDGVNRLDTILSVLFHAEPDDLTAWASRYLFLAAVQRTFEPGCQMDEIPVLIGPQGIGKSSLLALLVPREMPELYTAGFRWDMRIEQQIEATRERAIVEVSEMAGRARAEIEHIKAFITTRDDGYIRSPYARAPESSPRRFIIVGTTNNENDLPNDPTGNRRLVPVVLKQGNNIELWIESRPNEARPHDTMRDLLWAEAMHDYNQGKRANLPRDLHDDAAERAEEHRDRDDLIEDVIEENLLRDRAYLIGEVMALFRDHAQKPSQQRVGKALENAGWTKQRRRIDGERQVLWLSGR